MPGSPLTPIKNAPVATLTTIESLVAAVLTFLVSHQIIGDVDVSATTQTIAPFVALALPAVFGAMKWRLVTPYEKVKELTERDGLVSDADFARISALLEDKLQDWGLVAADPPPDADDVAEDVADADADAEADADADAEAEAGYEAEAESDAEADDLPPMVVDDYVAEHGSDVDGEHLPEHAAFAAELPSGMSAGAARS